MTSNPRFVFCFTTVPISLFNFCGFLYVRITTECSTFALLDALAVGDNNAHFSRP